MNTAKGTDHIARDYGNDAVEKATLVFSRVDESFSAAQ